MKCFRSRGSLQLLGVILVLCITPTLLQAEQTVGLFLYDSSSSDGYTLLRAQVSSTAYLIDEFGREVHSWTDSSYNFSGVPYLQENGNLVRMVDALGGETSHLAKYDWDGDKIWDWTSFDTSYHQHHDIAPLPNGNVLVIARQSHSVSEFIAAGGDMSKFIGTELLAEIILEVMPTGPTTGTIVWQWSIMDHLIQDFDSTKANYGVVEDHPELLDLNYGDKVQNWLHANGINYNAEFDQISLSLRLMSEFWVIDHSTSTGEASGHTGGDRGMGGDLIYRWGNPLVYRRGDLADQQLSWQHNAHWIAQGSPGAGNMIVFSNGNDWGYSSVVELDPPADAFGNYPQPLAGTAHEPAAPTWTYIATPPESFFATRISGCQRLRNGNTLMVNGPIGEIREVNPAGDIVWFYVNPMGSDGRTVQGEAPKGYGVFRINRFPFDYPAFEGKTFSPGESIELYPVTISGATVFPLLPKATDPQVVIRATITSDSGLASTTAMVDTGDGYFAYPMFDDGLHMDGVANDSLFGATLGPLSPALAVSYYVVAVDDSTNIVNDPYNSPTIVYQFTVEPSCCNGDGIRGNVDDITGPGGPIDVSDLTYMVSYLFKGGPIPPCVDEGNVDGVDGPGGPIDVSDLTYLVGYLFKGGPLPAVCP